MPVLLEWSWVTGVIVNFTAFDRGWVRTGDWQNDIYFDYRALPTELHSGPADGLLVSCQILYREGDEGRFTRQVLPAAS